MQGIAAKPRTIFRMLRDLLTYGWKESKMQSSLNEVNLNKTLQHSHNWSELYVQMFTCANPRYPEICLKLLFIGQWSMFKSQINEHVSSLLLILPLHLHWEKAGEDGSVLSSCTGHEAVWSSMRKIPANSKRYPFFSHNVLWN